MPRSARWFLANVGIAVAIVFAGISIVIVTDPEASGTIVAKLLGSAFITLWVAPSYMPSVFVYLLLLLLLVRRFPARAAALASAPLAPGFLWLFVFEFRHPLIVAIAIVGTVVYGALVRLPDEHWVARTAAPRGPRTRAVAP